MANISHFTQTVNGISTTYDIHDADAVPRSGGAVMAGGGLYKTRLDSQFEIGGGASWDTGALILLAGKDYSYNDSNGRIRFHVTDGTNSRDMLLYPSGTWIWNGAAVQLVSDQRLKQQIAEIDDKLLDAWEDVNIAQFKYNDAVDEKGTKARLHTGYVVQQIDKACKSHGVDVSQYGLYCHEEYPQESEHYSLRYTEVYAVECMYLRRCIARLTARIEELEKGNNIKL